MKLELTQDQKEEIKQLHRTCKARKYADRLKALLMLDKGFSCTEVGKLLLLDDDTIRKYRERYMNEGAQSLLEDNNKGTQPYLSSEQLASLDKHLTENVYQDSKGIVEWIKKEYGIDYTPTGVNALLKRMGFVYKKPVLTPCKSDEKKQKRFIEEYREIKDNLEEKDQLYFMDGVHPQHNSIASYGWIKKGETKQLKTNNGRKRININAVLNLATKQVFYVEDERINSQTVITLLMLLLKNQKEGKIYIILDNARYYHAKVVKEFLKEHPRIILKFLPAYSPNLNIIERLWNILKKKVVYNKFYLKFDDFKFAVDKFFKDKAWMKDEFKNTLTDNFQIINPNFSGSYL